MTDVRIHISLTWPLLVLTSIGFLAGAAGGGLRAGAAMAAYTAISLLAGYLLALAPVAGQVALWFKVMPSVAAVLHVDRLFWLDVLVVASSVLVSIVVLLVALAAVMITRRR